MRRFSLWAVAAALASTGAAADPDAPGQGAPFGLSWGPVSTVPRPSRAEREANLTALHYPRGWPPATGPGTAEVVLVVCRDVGLQQVVWVGLPLTMEEIPVARRAIHDEGVRLYGEPLKGLAPDAEVWPGGRALLATREVAGGKGELVMTAFGPGYVACSDTHRTETGHPAGAHVGDLIEGGHKGH